ncbi:hypothetical protein P7C70_g9104, partial [Phenoliferia sp. Uapishka_3]
MSSTTDATIPAPPRNFSLRSSTPNSPSVSNPSALTSASPSAGDAHIPNNNSEPTDASAVQQLERRLAAMEATNQEVLKAFGRQIKELECAAATAANDRAEVRAVRDQIDKLETSLLAAYKSAGDLRLAHEADKKAWEQQSAEHWLSEDRHREEEDRLRKQVVS